MNEQEQGSRLENSPKYVSRNTQWGVVCQKGLVVYVLHLAWHKGHTGCGVDYWHREHSSSHTRFLAPSISPGRSFPIPWMGEALGCGFEWPKQVAAVVLSWRMLVAGRSDESGS